MKPLRTFAPAVGSLLALTLLNVTVGLARDRHPGFSHQTLELPGIPAAVIPADINGDAVDDLVVMVAYTEWGSKSEFEQTSFKDIEGLVEVMTVVPALLDHRELRVYSRRATSEIFDTTFSAVELTASTHALQTGHPKTPLVAITDQGAAAVSLSAAVDAGRLDLSSVLDLPDGASRFAEEEEAAFFSDLDFLEDLDNDGVVDLLLPTVTGWSIYAGRPEGFDRQSRHAILDPRTSSIEERVEMENNEDDDNSPSRHHLLPAFQDINGDQLLDLLLFDRSNEGKPFIFLNEGDLEFSDAVQLEFPDDSQGDETMVFVGDLNRDGRAEVTSQQTIELPEDAGFRQEIDDAKKPRGTYRIYNLNDQLSLSSQPTHAFDAVGYIFGDEGDQIKLPGGFQDMNGDGRQDLVSITLDFSILPLLVRVIAVQRISLRMDFQVRCQTPDGSFVTVPYLDLSGKFKIDLNNVQIKHLSQFAGDFNGDGRADFVQLGRGRKVTIHFGKTNCGYESRPDLELKLRQEPRHLGFVRILDLNNDGRSDLYVVHPQGKIRQGESTPVKLDLYLSKQTENTAE
jgi:hypothetical protein